jgi:hypothetical protein
MYTWEYRRRTIGLYITWRLLKPTWGRARYALIFNLLNVEVSNCSCPIYPHTRAALIYQQWRRQILTGENSPCPIIDVIHHDMECIVAALWNMSQCVDMSLIHIEISISWEICWATGPSSPLIDGGVKLILPISMCYKEKIWTHRSCRQCEH